MPENVQGLLHRRQVRQSWSARLVTRWVREKLKGNPHIAELPIALVGELPTDGRGTFFLQLENRQRFRVNVIEVTHTGGVPHHR